MNKIQYDIYFKENYNKLTNLLSKLHFAINYTIVAKKYIKIY